MPTVPQAAPTVQSRPIDPGFQNASAATLDVFGGQNAAGLDQTGRRIAAAGDELHRLALKSMMEDNEREAKKLDVELSSALRSINYGDGTAQNPGYFGLKGEAALQGYEGAQKAVREAQKKLLDGAKNDRVKEMFGEVSARRLETELNTMARFVGQERVRAADTVSEARLSEAANDAARAWNNPQIIQRSVALAVNEVKDMAQRNGWGPEVEAAKTREAISVIATGAAKAALAVEATGAAQRIFKQYEGSFSPEARASISKQIRDGSVQHAAQALRDQAIARGGTLEEQAEFIRQKASGKIEDAALSSISTWHSIQRASQADRERAENKALRGESQAAFDRIQQAHPGDYQAQLEAAKKLSPELRDMVDQRIRSDHSIQNQLDEDVERAKRRAIQETELADRQRQRQEREDRKAANEQALAAVLAGTPISKLPPEVLNRLDRNDYVGLEKIERDVAAGHPAVTDWDYYGKVMQFSATQMADLSMTEAASKLGPREFAEVRSMHAKALRGELDPSVGTPNQMVQAKIRELGLTGDEAKRKRAGQLQSLFLEQMNAEAKATGKKVPHERATEILNNLVDTVTVPAWFGMSTAEKRAYTVLHEIKQPDRERIAARLRAAGLTPTAKNIIDYYQREQQRAR
jgi:hypothetical protein